MPIYQTTETHDEMQQKARTLKCQCGANLTVAWGGYYGHNCYILRCANNIEHSDFIRLATISNYDLPGYNMPGISRKKEAELVTKYGNETTKALVRAAGGNALSTLTEQSATKMINILWPDASKSESGRNAIAKAALICRDYGLNPAMDHVFLIPYKKRNSTEITWSVVRGIKASRLICGRDKSYGYIDDTPRIMTPEEQTRIFGEVDETNLVTICKLKDKDGNVFTGYGKWPHWKVYQDGNKYPNDPQGSDKGNSKFNMSCIRAERQALDKLNPGSMPAIDVVDENYMPKPKIVVTSDGAKVDQDTGEIKEPSTAGQPVEGSFTEEMPDIGNSPDPEWDKLDRNAPVQAVQKEAEKKIKKPEEVKSLGDLFKACIDQWPESFKTKADVLKEAGVNSQEDLTEKPSDVYAKIMAVRQPAAAPAG